MNPKDTDTMTTTADALGTLIKARAGLYRAILDHDRHDLVDVVTKLDEAIRILGAQHSRVMHAAFTEYLAANP